MGHDRPDDIFPDIVNIAFYCSHDYIAPGNSLFSGTGKSFLYHLESGLSRYGRLHHLR